MQIAAFLPIRLRPSPRPTVVVVLPSPAGVGLIAVTRISLPSLLPCQRLDEFGGDLRLVVAVGQKMLGGNAELGADLLDRLLVRRARDLDVGLDFGHGDVPRKVLMIFLAEALGGVRSRAPKRQESGTRHPDSATQWTKCDRVAGRPAGTTPQT